MRNRSDKTTEGNPSHGPTIRARDARQGEIILDTRRKRIRAVFILAAAFIAMAAFLILAD